MEDWDVSSVTLMNEMFSNASLFNGDLTGWDVSSVTDISYMFSNALLFNSDLSGWNVSNVRNMISVFDNASSFNQNISSWNISNVTNMNNMLNNSGISIMNFNNILNGWASQSVHSYITLGAYNLYYTRIGLPGYDVLVNTYNWSIQGANFSNTLDLVYSIPFSSIISLGLVGSPTPTYLIIWGDGSETSELTHEYSASGTYDVLVVVKNGSFTGFNNSSSTGMQYLTECTSFGGIGITDLSYAFYGATALTTVPSSIPSVTNMSSMFNSATSFNGDISVWNVESVTNMNSMFFGANAFNANISEWNVGSVTDMDSMFFNASSFSQNIGIWNMSSVTNVSTMLTYSGMDITTFNNVLNGWGSQSLQPNLNLGANALVYSSSGQTGYTALTTTPTNWTITGVAYTETTPITNVPFTLIYYDTSSFTAGNFYQLYYNNAAFSSSVEFVENNLTFSDITTSTSGRLQLTLQNESTGGTPVQTTNLTVDAICFKEHTKILTPLGYRAIEELKKGDLVSTFKHGNVPIYKIGSSHIHHINTGERNKDKLYCYSQKDYPELIEDLIVTGGHSMLVDSFPSKEEKDNLLLFKNIVYKTDDKYRLLSCVNSKCSIYDVTGVHAIYHIALENENSLGNYGIYANGLLVESCPKRYLDMSIFDQM